MTDISNLLDNATPRPWTDDMTPAIAAGDHRIRFNGEVPAAACRVLSEGNFQLAMAAVNALDLVRPLIAEIVKQMYTTGFDDDDGVSYRRDEHGNEIEDPITFGMIKRAAEAVGVPLS